MTARVTALWRHPIKGVGREAVSHVDVAEGQTMPGDRLWAIAHESSKAADNAWSRCNQFVRAASSPKLMAVTARSDGTWLELSHPDQASIRVDPAQDAERLIDWVKPLIAKDRAAAARLVKAPEGRGMTDTSSPSITLGNMASHRVVAARLGRALSEHRWRCNIWVDGLAPWEEFDLEGMSITIGTAKLHVYKRIDRCEAPSANPDTGRRDADILSVLEDYGHQDFTVGLQVTQAGRIAVGDQVDVS